jgi:hypothetical protein
MSSRSGDFFLVDAVMGDEIMGLLLMRVDKG